MTAQEHDDLLEQARAYVQRVHPRAPDVSTDDWVAAVVTHLEPLPADRAWLQQTTRRRPTRLGALAPRVTRTLTPPAGTRPQPRCPLVCFVTHHQDDAEAAA